MFDIKLGEKFHRKSIYCDGFHKTGSSYLLNCSAVVDKDFVIIIIWTAVFSDLSILVLAVQNDFLTAPNWYNFHLAAGSEFGTLEIYLLLPGRSID